MSYAPACNLYLLKLFYFQPTLRIDSFRRRLTFCRKNVFSDETRNILVYSHLEALPRLIAFILTLTKPSFKLKAGFIQLKRSRRST
jgi:hypothetical protein